MLPDPSLKWPICMAGVALIADAESCRLRAYRCPAGVWTIGWGETEGVQPGMVWTQQQADQTLCTELMIFAGKVAAQLNEPAEPNQLAALVSLAYNIGMRAFSKSTVLKTHNRGDFLAAAQAFDLWTRAKVRGVSTVLPGLVARRKAEAALYLKPEDDAPVLPMPQTFAPQPSMATSPTVLAGSVTAAGGALTIIGQVGDTLGPVKASVDTAKSFAADTLGIPTGYVLPGMALVLGGVVNA